MFLIHVGVFLFCNNNYRNPPEPTKNLSEQTEKPIKTNCKPCKNRLLHKNRIKSKDKEILEKWIVKQNDQKTYSNVELKKTEIFCICLDI